MKTKKQFKEYLNNKYKGTQWNNGKKMGQRVREYGDYLYTQDKTMFNYYYSLWLGGENI